MTTSTHFIPSESALELLCGTESYDRRPAMMHGMKKTGRVAAGTASSAVGITSLMFSALEETDVSKILLTGLSGFSILLASYFFINRTPEKADSGKKFYYGARKEGKCYGTPKFTRVGPTKREQNDHNLERVYPLTNDQIRADPWSFFGKLVFVNGAEISYVPKKGISCDKSETNVTSAKAHLSPKDVIELNIPGYKIAQDILSDSLSDSRSKEAPLSNSVIIPTPFWIMGRLYLRQHSDTPHVFSTSLALRADGAAFEAEKTLRDPNYTASRR